MDHNEKPMNDEPPVKRSKLSASPCSADNIGLQNLFLKNPVLFINLVITSVSKAKLGSPGQGVTL